MATTYAQNAAEITLSKGHQARRRWAQVSGLLLLAAGAALLMGIITAEALYPDTYTTHGNEIR